MLKGTKTPVSLLQEELLIRHLCPKYELVFDGTGVQNPKFTFRVQVGALSEEGTGRNKQEAKHRAAENMLKAMGLIKEQIKAEEEQEEDEEGIDDLDPVKNNHVGNLKEFCFCHHYPDPVYNLGEEAGPAHSKVFKIICTVSHLRQDGVARTKKAAKHKAAAKMLEQLKECVIEAPAAKEVIIIPEITLSKEKYKNAKFVSSQNVPNPLALYKDHHKAFLNLHEDSQTLAKLKSNCESFDSSKAVQLLEDIARELKVKLSFSEDLVVKQGSKKLVVVTMALEPAISEIESSYENAAFKLLKTLLILCS